MIDALSFNGGRGVGRHEGVVIFVPWTAPGDLVRVEIIENKKTFLIGRVDEFLEPSPLRREPRCPVFTRCGGCTWQHISYDEQIRQKKLILHSALKQWEEPFSLLEFAPSAEEFRYRNRIQVNRSGLDVGFFARGTRDVVDISDCPITEAELADRLPSLHEKPDGRYEISRRTDGSVVVEAGRRNPEAALFSQVNTKQNSLLIETVVKWAHELSFDEIWDLYCGSGNLTLPLAQAFPLARTTGVELSEEAIQIARKNLNAQVTWIAEDVGRFLSKQKAGKSLLIVLDPPRIGVDGKAIDQLGRTSPNYVIYVSCNPMTFSRDARRLKTFGYALDRVQGFDMFPQTEHVELISLFRRVMSR